MKFKTYLTLFIFTAISTLSFSTDDYAKSSYKSIRSMGMGGTNVTTALDEAALIYNPALLKILKKHKLLIPGFADFANSNSKRLHGERLDTFKRHFVEERLFFPACRRNFGRICATSIVRRNRPKRNDANRATTFELWREDLQ